jgi:5-methylcytosine-specific restriction protein A
MNRPENQIERSYPMIITSYWLSRCGQKVEAGPSDPPISLDVRTWKAAYDIFYDAFGDGRTPQQFRNSIKNARDTFDILFDNGRIGWTDRNGQQSSGSNSFQRVHEEWKDRQDQELEAFVLGLQSGLPNTNMPWVPSPDARTEGGKKVYVSVRYERDPRLRDEAIRIHGLACMACGFDFAKTYGSFGAGFAEVHHMIPLADAGSRKTDPTTDLKILCANCHRMVHRKRGVCLSLAELKAHLAI